MLTAHQNGSDARILTFRRGPLAEGSAVLTMLMASGPEFAVWEFDSGDIRPTGIGTDGFTQSSWVSADGNAVTRLGDYRGNELGHLWLTPLDDPAKARDLTPGWSSFAVRGGEAGRDGRHQIALAVNADGFQLLLLDVIGEHKPVVLYRNEAEAWHARLSADGAFACLDTTDHSPGQRRHAVSVVETRGGEVVNRFVAGRLGSATAACFSPLPGDQRLLVTTSPEGASYSRAVLWDPLTDETCELPGPEQADTNVIGIDWHESGRVLLGAENRGAQRLLLADTRTGDARWLDELPAGSYWSAHIRAPQFDTNGDVLVGHETSRDPLTILRVSEGSTTPQLTAGAATGSVARSVTLTSADSTQIQAWLHTPSGPGPHPAVVRLHGGPHTYTANEFAASAGVWVNEGFAYLDLNYRGSTGRERAFAEQVWGDVGRLELEDMRAAHEFLIAQGIARPDQIFVTGVSYGGYLTLYAMGRQPELWAGGIALSAIGDWRLAYRDAPEALRSAFRLWFGGTPDERPELYADRSPVTHAEHVRRPLLIQHGRFDSRTSPAQLSAYVDRLVACGADVEVDWFDSGHGEPGLAEAERQRRMAVRFARSVIARDSRRGAQP